MTDAEMPSGHPDPDPDPDPPPPNWNCHECPNCNHSSMFGSNDLDTSYHEKPTPAPTACVTLGVRADCSAGGGSSRPRHLARRLELPVIRFQRVYVSVVTPQADQLQQHCYSQKGYRHQLCDYDEYRQHFARQHRHVTGTSSQRPRTLNLLPPTAETEPRWALKNLGGSEKFRGGPMDCALFSREAESVAGHQTRDGDADDPRPNTPAAEPPGAYSSQQRLQLEKHGSHDSLESSNPLVARVRGTGPGGFTAASAFAASAVGSFAEKPRDYLRSEVILQKPQQHVAQPKLRVSIIGISTLASVSLLWDAALHKGSVCASAEGSRFVENSPVETSAETSAKKAEATSFMETVTLLADLAVRGINFTDLAASIVMLHERYKMQDMALLRTAVGSQQDVGYALRRPLLVDGDAVA